MRFGKSNIAAVRSRQPAAYAGIPAGPAQMAYAAPQQPYRATHGYAPTASAGLRAGTHTSNRCGYPYGQQMQQQPQIQPAPVDAQPDHRSPCTQREKDFLVMLRERRGAGA